MGTLDLTVQVLNISPQATKDDLITFFSYCGTIDEIQLQRDGDQSQVAVVTFRQPYARETALLLNDAIIIDRQVRILPLEDGMNVPIIFFTTENMDDGRGGGGFIPANHSAVQAAAAAAAAAAALRGQEVLNRAKDPVSYTGRTLTQQANRAISAAEQTVGSIGSAIVSSSRFSKSALWLSSVLDRASKSMAELGNAKGRDLNSRKQK